MSFFSSLAKFALPVLADAGSKLFTTGVESLSNYVQDKWFKKNEQRSSLPNIHQLQQPGFEYLQNAESVYYPQSTYTPRQSFQNGMMQSSIVSDQDSNFGKGMGIQTLGASFMRSDNSLGNMNRGSLFTRNYGTRNFINTTDMQQPANRNFGSFSSNYGGDLYSTKPRFLNGNPNIYLPEGYNQRVVPQVRTQYNDSAMYGSVQPYGTNSNELVRGFDEQQGDNKLYDDYEPPVQKRLSHYNIPQYQGSGLGTGFDE